MRDFTLTLFPEQTVKLFKRKMPTEMGHRYDNVSNETIRLQEAAVPIADGIAPFTGIYIPDGNLNILNGKNSYGTWKLKILDTDGEWDEKGGLLKNWKLCLEKTPGEKVFSSFKKIYISY